MGSSPIFLAATLRKLIIYCKSIEVKSHCVCSLNPEFMPVFIQTIPDVRVSILYTEGRFLVSKPSNYRYEKVDVERVATEIQENDEPMPNICFPGALYPLWRPCTRFVEATFFRHLYRKCDLCTYFTNDIGAFGYRCPHCNRANSPKVRLYIAQTKSPEQPMHAVWYRTAPNLYLVTDDLESYPLSHHKEMYNASDFQSKLRKLQTTEGYEDIRVCHSGRHEVLKKLGKWEDLI